LAAFEIVSLVACCGRFSALQPLQVDSPVTKSGLDAQLLAMIKRSNMTNCA